MAQAPSEWTKWSDFQPPSGHSSLIKPRCGCRYETVGMDKEKPKLTFPASTVGCHLAPASLVVRLPALNKQELIDVLLENARLLKVPLLRVRLMSV